MTREKLREWIIENCLVEIDTKDEMGNREKISMINLSGLDLRGYTVDISCMKADEIDQSNQVAEYIGQEFQKAIRIDQFRHEAKIINQSMHIANEVRQVHRDVHKLYTDDLVNYVKKLDRANDEYYTRRIVNDN